MNIISVNVARPRLVVWNNQTISTGIFKEPVAGRVMLRTLNLDGDRQADLKVHGGPSKAVYAYPFEHYAWWREELPGSELPCGMFGENFTITGLHESEVRIGDHFRIGAAAEVVVSEPRLPCYKLGIKFGRTDILKRFLASGRTGFYFSVRREGEVEAGDAVELLTRAPESVTVADVISLYVQKERDPELLRRASRIEALPHKWRDHFREQLAKEQS